MQLTLILSSYQKCESHYSHFFFHLHAHHTLITPVTVRGEDTDKAHRFLVRAKTLNQEVREPVWGIAVRQGIHFQMSCMCKARFLALLFGEAYQTGHHVNHRAYYWHIP